MIYGVLIVFVVLLDQWSKKKALDFFQRSGPSYGRGKRFQLRLAKNTGAFYGIFKNRKSLLIAVTSLAIMGCVVLLYVGVVSNQIPSYNLALALLIGGAVGNLVDRIKRGYVVDFLFFNVKNGPIFNLGDVFILIGAIILCYLEVCYGVFTF